MRIGITSDLLRCMDSDLYETNSGFGGKIGVGGSVLIWKRDIVDKERITTD